MDEPFVLDIKADKSSVNVKLTSDPTTKEFETKTGSDGKWSIMDDWLQFGTKYQLSVSFNDVSETNVH